MGRMDEAVEVANRVLCDYYDANTDDTKASPNDAMRAALLAGVKVLLGEPVAWQERGVYGVKPGAWYEVSKQAYENLIRDPDPGYEARPLYAPSLGEGDGR